MQNHVRSFIILDAPYGGSWSMSRTKWGPILVFKYSPVGSINQKKKIMFTNLKLLEKFTISQILGFGDYCGKKYVAQILRNVNSKRRGFSFSKNL